MPNKTVIMKDQVGHQRYRAHFVNMLNLLEGRKCKGRLLLCFLSYDQKNNISAIKIKKYTAS